MTLFANPDIVACPQCDWYFARPVLQSYNTFTCVTYSDGSTTNSLEAYIPNVGRCPSCNFVINNINDLAVIPKITKPSWSEKLWAKLSGKGLNTEYEYLHKPTFSDYAELFANTDKLMDKRNWAVQACRAFHQAYCLPAENESETHSGDNKHTVYANVVPSKVHKVLYQEISDFVLDNPILPLLDEYTLICADIYRLRADFSSAILEYHKVKNPKFDAIVEQGYKYCVERNAKLMELRL